jgi:hypothetical protein
MKEIVDAVPPHRAPAIGAEQFFDRRFRLAAVECDRPLVDQKRHRIVRHKAVVGEDNRCWFDLVAGGGHDALLTDQRAAILDVPLDLKLHHLVLEF